MKAMKGAADRVAEENEAEARFMNPCPASPAFSTAPKMTKMATTLTDTPVSDPQMPPSAMVSVPRNEASGVPEWPNSPGICWP